MFFNFLTFVLALLSIICMAAIIYPFKPFKKRSLGAFGFVVTSILFIFFSLVNINSPEYMANEDALAKESLQTANIALSAKDYAKAEATLAGISNFVSTDKQKEIAQIRSTIALRRDLPIMQDIISKNDYDVLTKLQKVKSLWEDLQDNEVALRALSPELEPLILNLVKPIPSNELVPNRLGYELLVSIDAYTDEKKPSYVEKAKSYARKIEGCSIPNYEFALQVPRRLNDPRSFKPVRVYWGSYNNNDTQRTVYMDYRAKNGFGSVISNTATGVVNLSTCRFTLRSIE